MKIKKINSYYFIKQLENFKIHKKTLLNLISKIPEKQRKSDIEQISNTDWNIPRNYNRDYLIYFYDIIKDYMNELSDFLCVTQWSISNAWYQQYYKNDRHDWHTHSQTHYTNVFYLELPIKKYKTEIYDCFTQKLINIDVKEGDILTFPAYYNHRSVINQSNKRKTIISFNSNFNNSNIKKIGKTLTN
jgi:hypothetical protein